jgi:hypothetical protein
MLAMFFIIPAVGYGTGWRKGFPRWSYPYGSVLLLISLYFMNASTPGISFFGYEGFGRELWGWRSRIPLVIATIRGRQPGINAILVRTRLGQHPRDDNDGLQRHSRDVRTRLYRFLKVR